MPLDRGSRLVLVLSAALLWPGDARSRSDCGRRSAERAEESSSRRRSGRCWSVAASSATGRKRARAGCGSTRATPMLKGGESGPVVVPGKPDESPLIEAIRYDGDVQMPPKGKLKDEEIAALTEWVKRGAFWPAARPGAATGSRSRPPATAAAGSRRPTFKLDGSSTGRSGRSSRSRSPRRRRCKNAAWPRSPIDRFILAKLEAERPGAGAGGRQGRR